MFFRNRHITFVTLLYLDFATSDFLRVLMQCPICGLGSLNENLSYFLRRYGVGVLK